MSLVRYAGIGFLFGLVLMKSEAISWFRIQEMFRFQSIHMYGILGCAVLTAGIALRVLRKAGVHAATGELIAVAPKQLGTGARYAIGGTCFGLGWALTGACPGPLFTLLGAGVSVMAAAIAAALVGTWSYAMARSHLPH